MHVDALWPLHALGLCCVALASTKHPKREAAGRMAAAAGAGAAGQWESVFLVYWERVTTEHVLCCCRRRFLPVWGGLIRSAPPGRPAVFGAAPHFAPRSGTDRRCEEPRAARTHADLPWKVWAGVGRSSPFPLPHHSPPPPRKEVMPALEQRQGSWDAFLLIGS